MSRHHGSSERERTLPFGIAADWTPEQAVAVVELLDELRELIYAHYLHQIQDQMRTDRQSVSRRPPEFDSCARKLLIYIAALFKNATTAGSTGYQASVFLWSGQPECRSVLR